MLCRVEFMYVPLGCVSAVMSAHVVSRSVSFGRVPFRHAMFWQSWTVLSRRVLLSHVLLGRVVAVEV